MMASISFFAAATLLSSLPMITTCIGSFDGGASPWCHSTKTNQHQQADQTGHTPGHASQTNSKKK